MNKKGTKKIFLTAIVCGVALLIFKVFEDKIISRLKDLFKFFDLISE